MQNSATLEKEKVKSFFMKTCQNAFFFKKSRNKAEKYLRIFQ